MGNPDQYANLLTAMVRSWRRQFGSRLPLVIVQLAGYMQQHDQPLQQSGWCTIREGQRKASQQLADAALATAVDLGEWNDLHPQRKDELGRRVALQLRRLAYGEKKLVAEGPRPVSAKLKGGAVVVTFDKRTGALRPADEMPAFALAGADGRFVWAKARTKGKSAVLVDVPDGLEPVRMRYAWDDYPVLSLYNQEGLPSGTFERPVSSSR